MDRIKKGHYIAFSGKTLTVNEATLSLAAVKAAKLLLGKSHRALTVLYSDSVNEQSALSLKNKIESSLGGKADVTMLSGGQKIYCLSLLAD